MAVLLADKHAYLHFQPWRSVALPRGKTPRRGITPQLATGQICPTAYTQSKDCILHVLGVGVYNRSGCTSL